MREKPTIRLFRFGDESRLNDFFNLIFGTCRSLDEWRRKFVRPSQPPTPFILIAEAEGRIVGTYAAMRHRFSVEGTEMDLFQHVDAAIDPHYRSFTLLKRLYYTMLDVLAPHGAFGMGFPGMRHFTLGQLALDFRDLGPMKELSLRLEEPSASSMPPVAGWEGFAITSQEAVCDLGPRKPSSGALIYQPRTADFVWERSRFAELGQALVLRDVAARGFMILSHVQDTVRIMDFVAHEQGAADRLVSCLVDWARRASVLRVSGYFIGMGVQSEALKRSGFIENPEEHFRPTLFLYPSRETPSIALHGENWALSLFDTDL